MKQFRIYAILVAILMLVTAQAEGSVSEAGVLYLRVAAGARPAGMGEAFVALADDATATYWNPAGLASEKMAGKMEYMTVPGEYGMLTDMAVQKVVDGGTNIWMLAENQILMFDGKGWETGKEYLTSSEQTFYDFLRSVVSIDDEKKLRPMAEKVIFANCQVRPDEIDAFIEAVRKHTPDDYKDKDELEKGFNELSRGYNGCLLKTDRFVNLQEKLKDGLKDSVMTSGEMDKITYSLHQAVYRFLPGRLIVPYSAGFDGSPTCLAGTGNYVWVGTDNGLFRSAGQTWARYSTHNGLPSDDIISMASHGDHLLIGTSRGIAEYFHGSFTSFDGLPDEPVMAIAYGSATDAYAAIGGVIYRYSDGKWRDSYSYTVRIDDSIDDLVARVAIYNTPAEKQYLIQKIRELNAGNVSSPVTMEVPAVTEDEIQSMDGTDESIEATDQDGSEISQDVADDIDVAIDDVEKEMDLPQGGSEPVAGVDPWLFESNVIQLPYSPDLRYDVTALAVDVYNTLWVGTASGLLSFSKSDWKLHGYSEFVIPPGESLLAEQIAHLFLDFPYGENQYEDGSERTSPDYGPKRSVSRKKGLLLAQNIDQFNDLNGEPAEAGRTVLVYDENVGSNINSIGSIGGEMYAGTEYGLYKLSFNGWEPVTTKDLGWKKVVAMCEQEDQYYYASADGLTSKTKGIRNGEVVFMHVNWLPSLVDDMYYDFFSFVYHLRGAGTIGVSMIYLTYGEIPFVDEHRVQFAEGHPFEIAGAISYGTSLTSEFKAGITGKIIHSRLSTVGVGEEQGEGIATAFAIDVGIQYKISDRMQIGAAVTNLGPNISYIDAAQSDPLPRNFAVGLAYKVWDTRYNKLVVQGELNRMLVGVENFGSGVETAIRHVGAEYWYSNLIALRAGYKYDKEGQVKHLTFGTGLQLKPFRADFAYVPSSKNSPLANTLRISFTFGF